MAMESMQWFPQDERKEVITKKTGRRFGDDEHIDH